MNGYLGIVGQYIDEQDQIVSRPMALRYVPKGETGHTIERIHAETVSELRELAVLVAVEADKVNISFRELF